MMADERARDVAAEQPGAILAHLSGARTGLIHDALSDADVGSLLDLLPAPAPRPRHAVAVARGTLSVETFVRPRVSGGSERRLSRISDARNIVTLIGEDQVLKLFRRLDPGAHPEVAIRRHVTGPGGFGRVPRVHATLVYRTPAGESMTLGVLGEQLPQQRNGWDHAVTDVERYLDRAAAERNGPPDDAVRPAFRDEHVDLPVRVREAIGGYLETCGLIGRRLAELHLALSKPGEGFGHAHEGATQYFDDVVAAIEAQRTVVSALVPERRDWPDPLAAELSAALEAWSAWHPQLSALARRAVPDTVLMRVHNDLNLGQILLHQQDVLFLDFDGDPDRSLEWRARRHSPLRDVATMGHSFRYAASTGLRRYAATRPHDAERLAPWAELWRRWTSAVFLEGYRAGVAGTPLAAVNLEARAAAFDLLTIDQALQDLEMEVRSRPEWVPLPLGVVRDTLER